jgi:hypothetical protein
MRSPRLLHAGIALSLLATLSIAGCSGQSSEPVEEESTTEISLIEPSTDESATDSDSTDNSEGEADEDSNVADAERGEPSLDIPWVSGASESPMANNQTSLLAHDFRVGLHDDYYRVVVEFVGEGTPGWTIDWVEEGTEIGRGEPLPIPQGNVLDIMIHGASWPVVKGAPEYYYNGPADKRIDENVLAWFDGAFESETHVVVSSDKVREYRVFTLESPKRLVVDLKR